MRILVHNNHTLVSRDIPGGVKKLTHMERCSPDDTCHAHVGDEEHAEDDDDFVVTFPYRVNTED